MATQPCWRDEEEAPEPAPAFWAESEFEFYARRAIEEGNAARRASCPEAAAAHLYLAAAYAAEVSRETERTAQLERLAHAIRRRADAQSSSA